MKKLFIFLLLALMPAVAYAGSAWDGNSNTATWVSSGSDIYYTTGDVAVGDTNFYEAFTVGGGIALKELAVSPGATAGYGKLYTKTDGLIYFRSSGGAEFNLTAGGGGGAIWGGITGTLALQTDLNLALAGKEPTIAAGTSAQYYRGDKTWQTLDTSAVPENGQLYYLDSRARLAITCTAAGLTWTSGTGVLSLTAGYAIPTTAASTNWNSAYTHKTTEDAINGLVKVDGSGNYSALTDNSANWNDAYSKEVTTWTAPITYLAGVVSMAKSSAAVDGYLDNADFATFAAKENALTFSTGLNRSTDTITAKLSTGVAGGQYAYGGVSASDNLHLQSTTHATRGYIIADDSLICWNTLMIRETGASPTFYTSFQTGDQAGDVSYTWPTSQAGGAGYVLANDGSGVLSWSSVGGIGGANTALSNLATVAINTNLLPDSDNDTDLGNGSTYNWRTGYFDTSVVTPLVQYTGNITVDAINASAASTVYITNSNGTYVANLNVEGGITSSTLDTGQGANELYDMDQNVLTTSAVQFLTVDTGQGANELYDMDQNVLTTSAVTFATVDTGQGANELYDMNQNVQSTDLVTFNKVTVTTDFVGASTTALYFGDPATDGTWRIVRNGNDLEFQRRESGSYVSKGSFAP